MSLSEYSVPDDFFQSATETSDSTLMFPCNVCRFSNDPNEVPCKYCGHNENAQEYYYCSLCGEIQDGNYYTEGNYIAKDTGAQIAGVCSKCLDLIKKIFLCEY